MFQITAPVEVPTGLALHAGERSSVVDDQVVARVLAERDEDFEPGLAQSEHYCELSAVPDVFRMLHPTHLAKGIGWAVSKLDNTTLVYYVAAPE